MTFTFTIETELTPNNVIFRDGVDNSTFSLGSSLLDKMQEANKLFADLK